MNARKSDSMKRLALLAVNLGYSTTEVGRSIGVRNTTVKYWAKKYKPMTIAEANALKMVLMN